MTNQEDIFLIIGYCLMFLFLVFKLTRKKVKGSIWLHFLIFLVYTIIIFYNRIYNTEYGSSLLWLYYGAMTLVIHAAFMVLQRLIKY